jgi:hypothetical protein
METLETKPTPKLSQTARILRLLKQEKRATNRQLNSICFRYGARIHELRNEGHIIVTNRLHDNLYEFVYQGYDDSLLKEFSD